MSTWPTHNGRDGIPGGKLASWASLVHSARDLISTAEGDQGRPPGDVKLWPSQAHTYANIHPDTRSTEEIPVSDVRSDRRGLVSKWVTRLLLGSRTHPPHGLHASLFILQFRRPCNLTIRSPRIPCRELERRLSDKHLLFLLRTHPGFSSVHPHSEWLTNN